MDQITVFREKYQQGTAYMSENLKSIEKRADGKFKEAENYRLEREYMSAMEQGYTRMRVFGVRSSTFGKMDNVTAAGMQGYCIERKEAQRNHQIAESAKKKKGKQEEDAKNRMHQPVVEQLQRTAENSAAHVLQLYSEKKEQGQPVDMSMQGTEFYKDVKQEMADGQTQEQKISNLLLKRDALAKKVKNAQKPTGDVEKAEQNYDRQLLEKLNDALQSWMLVGGVSGNGTRVSDREKTKALQHLPLAIQDYEYYAKNRGMLIGGMIFDKVKKTKEYENTYKEWDNIDRESTKQTLGIDQPIANIYKDDIANLRSLISENGPYDADKQRLLQNVYADYMKHSIAFAKCNLEYKAAAYTLASESKSKEYLEAWWDQNDFVSRQHEMAMDAAEAYLKYLIKGKNPDPTLAVYIEAHWQTDAFAENLDKIVDEVYGDKETYLRRIEERREQIRQNSELSQEGKRKLLGRLDGAEELKHNDRAERLRLTSPVERAFQNFMMQKCMVAEKDLTGTGYRDVTRLLVPVSGSLIGVDAEYIKKRKIGIAKCAAGKYFGDQKDENNQVIENKKDGMPCSKEERLEELPAWLEALAQAQQDLQQFMDAHKLAGKKSLEQSYMLTEPMVEGYKKSQALRDVSAVFCKSDLFGELPEETQRQLLDAWNFGEALTMMIHEYCSLNDSMTNCTLREAIEEYAEDLRCLDKTWEDYMVRARELHQELLDIARERARRRSQ